MKMSYPILAHQEICAENGMVAAQHPLGAQVGLDVLRHGGNAVDAAVTTAFAMGVLQPLMNGIGGGGVMVVFLDGGGGGTVDYGMQSPGLARGDMYELEDELVPPEVNSNRLSRQYSYPAVKNNANVEGHTSIGVPGTVAGLSAALEKWGSIDLDQAIAPAIRLAGEGFQLGHRMILWLVENRGLLQRFPETAGIYYSGGWPLLSGETWVQKDHAETLRKIARNGPDAFYKGDIATMICDDITQNGGFLRASDFEQYRPIVYRLGARRHIPRRRHPRGRWTQRRRIAPRNPQHHRTFRRFRQRLRSCLSDSYADRSDQNGRRRPIHISGRPCSNKRARGRAVEKGLRRHALATFGSGRGRPILPRRPLAVL